MSVAKSQLIDVKHARRRFALPALKKFRLGSGIKGLVVENTAKAINKGKLSCKLCSQKMDLVAQSNEWINKPGTMGRSQSDLPTTRTDQLQNQARSRRTNSLGKVQTASDSDLAAQGTGGHFSSLWNSDQVQIVIENLVRLAQLCQKLLLYHDFKFPQ